MGNVFFSGRYKVYESEAHLLNQHTKNYDLVPDILVEKNAIIQSVYFVIQSVPLEIQLIHSNKYKHDS